MQPSGFQMSVFFSGGKPCPTQPSQPPFRALTTGTCPTQPSQPSYRALATGTRTLRGYAGHALLMAEEETQLTAWARCHSDLISPAC